MSYVGYGVTIAKFPRLRLIKRDNRNEHPAASPVDSFNDDTLDVFESNNNLCASLAADSGHTLN